METSSFYFADYKHWPSLPAVPSLVTSPVTPETEQVMERPGPIEEPDAAGLSDDADDSLSGDGAWNSLPADDASWDAFLADEDELDPLPEPGDFWFDDG